MTRKIAIVRISERNYDRDSHEYCIVADSITDWEEVTEEDYKALIARQYDDDFRVIERLPAAEIVPQTVKAYLAAIQKAKDQEARRKKENEARLANQREKAKLKKEKQLVKLAEAAGLLLVPKDQAAVMK
jgi:hypothetical protein